MSGLTAKDIVYFLTKRATSISDLFPGAETLLDDEEDSNTTNTGNESSEEELEDLDETSLAGLDDDENSKNSYNNVAEAARDFVANKPSLKAGHCWDWVNKVYEAAGYAPKPIYQDLNYQGKEAGTHRASESLLRGLQPGDWIYINNRNKYDTHGNHSVIFLGWKGPNIAEVASYFNGRSHIHTYDVNKYPVTHISKPVPKKKSSMNIDDRLKILKITKSK